MNSAANRVLLGCVLACAAGALAIALGASGVAGAVITAALAGLTILSASSRSADSRPARSGEPWHPVQVVTRAALLAVAVTAGASLVAYGMNQGSSPTTSNVGGNDSQQYPAPGATFAPVQDEQRAPETEPSSVEESLTESPSESATDTPADEPTRREPRPSANPEPTPSAEPTPEPSPEPSPTPTPTETESGEGCVLGLVCPPRG
ncbi:MAG TPA: hypothetical protein VFK52_07050 [Nocardioidaceae bacterium]|nr:hypothetical protein [Nocardioidaceae bacterium]